MLAKSKDLLDREIEWAALARFIERGQRLALVYGPRRAGKSYLLDAACESAGGLRYQAVTGVATGQLADLGRTLGEWLGAGPLHLDGWADALERLTRLDAPFVAIDEFPYLIEAAPELPSLLQRHLDSGQGPPLVLAGSALSTMTGLLEGRAPLYGRASAVIVPRPFSGADLSALWGNLDPARSLWVDAALGGLPGYRPLLTPPGPGLDSWMAEDVLGPASPLLDASEATLADIPDLSALRGAHRGILAAIAAGERTFSGISRVAGLPSGALSRPLAMLERAGLVERVPDPLRARRNRYELADPHLRFWLSVVAPNRARLQAGRSAEVWSGLRETAWPSQILGPRWEAVVRSHIEQHGVRGQGAVDRVGVTAVSDRSARRKHEVDLLAMRSGEVVAIGEAKLRKLGPADLERLTRIRELLDTPNATLILASASGVDPEAADAAIAIEPDDIYA